MKKTFLILFALLFSLYSFAQDQPRKEEDKPDKIHGFKKENLFTGGSVSFGLSNGTTSFGLIPHFGYSINKYVDVAVSLNFNYTSQRDYLVYGDKVRQTVIGPGAFVRLFPVRFLFAQGQFEHNFIRLKYHPADNSGYIASTQHFGGNSMLVGAGYAQGREDGNLYYYVSIMFDAGKSQYSPYKDDLGRNIPVIKAGINIALFQGKRGY